ncbi:uncharacterized protein LOC116089740 isoform X1 [Mastomys coucha]|uniref:uncharacterized protein LOC116089740 isoform X1 n=1 Tax=Mastomys coucha TaxID=35658 RepID=UPI00126286C4|nr:uncharacterized protein LOC116089740 isoform X1 [Mastomys coucha]
MTKWPNVWRQASEPQFSPSDKRPPVSQPPRPRTSFSVPQPNIDTLPQWGKHLQASQPPRPGSPFSVPQPDSNTLSQCRKHTTSRDLRDFVPPGLLRPTRPEFRCQKPYDDHRLKKPGAHVTEELQKLKACIKASANKRTLGPLRDLKEKKKWTVPLPLRVPEGMSKPLTRDTRPSVLQPATRKRVASTSVPIPGKVKRSRPRSTGFEEPMEVDQLGTRVPATSTKHSTRDASEKFKEDHTAPGPSSADSSVGQCGQHVGQDPSGQGDLQQGPSDKEGPKPSSPKGSGVELWNRPSSKESSTEGLSVLPATVSTKPSCPPSKPRTLLSEGPSRSSPPTFPLPPQARSSPGGGGGVGGTIPWHPAESVMPNSLRT